MKRKYIFIILFFLAGEIMRPDRTFIFYPVSVITTFKTYEFVCSFILTSLQTERTVWVSMSMCYNSKPPKQRYNYKVLIYLWMVQNKTICLLDRHTAVRLPLAAADPSQGDGHRGLRARRHEPDRAGRVRGPAGDLGGGHPDGWGQHELHLWLRHPGSLAEKPGLEQPEDRREGPGDDQRERRPHHDWQVHGATERQLQGLDILGRNLLVWK